MIYTGRPRLQKETHVSLSVSLQWFSDRSFLKTTLHKKGFYMFILWVGPTGNSIASQQYLKVFSLEKARSNRTYQFIFLSWLVGGNRIW